LPIVSADFGTTLGLKSAFLFQCPKASALTEFLGPFWAYFYLIYSGRSSM